MDNKSTSEFKWHYFVSDSGMSGVTIDDPDEVALYRAKRGWHEVTSDEFNSTLNRASYDTRGMGYEE